MPSSVLWALVVYVLYLAVVGVLWRVRRVDYLRLAESDERVRDGIVVPIGAGLVLLVVATTLLGWWGPALTQVRTGPSWALVAPVALAVAGIAGAFSIDWRSAARSRLPLLALGVLLVGAAEELLTRGLLVVGARDAGWAEPAVFAFSTLLFAALHALNGFFGQPWRFTAAQLVLSFLGGCAFYATRMTTGSLVVCMVLHALWDFGTLGTNATGSKPKPLQLVLVPLAYLAGVAAVWGVLTA